MKHVKSINEFWNLFKSKDEKGKHFIEMRKNII